MALAEELDAVLVREAQVVIEKSMKTCKDKLEDSPVPVPKSPWELRGCTAQEFLGPLTEEAKALARFLRGEAPLPTDGRQLSVVLRESAEVVLWLSTVRDVHQIGAILVQAQAIAEQMRSNSGA